MDTLWQVFNWLMVHQPPFPSSLVLGVSTAIVLALFVDGAKRYEKATKGTPEYDSANNQAWGGFVSLGILVFFSSIALLYDYWFHWISILLGIGAYLAFCAIVASVSSLVKNLGCWWQEGRAASRARHQRKAEAEYRAREAARQAEEKSPKHIIAKYKAIVEDYKRGLPPDDREERLYAGDLLKALEWLFGLLAVMDKRLPDGPSALAEKIREADSIFADVSLEKKCPDFIADLRQEHQTSALTHLSIHEAIEKVILLIEILPDQAGDGMPQQVLPEYQRVAERIRRRLGDKPFLPEIALAEATVTPLEVVPQAVPSTAPRRQTA